jgi:hypothetical protein
VHRLIQILLSLSHATNNIIEYMHTPESHIDWPSPPSAPNQIPAKNKLSSVPQTIKYTLEQIFDSKEVTL